MFVLIDSTDKLINDLACLEQALAEGHSVTIIKNEETIKIIQFPPTFETGGHSQQMLIDGLQVFSLAQVMFHLAHNRSCLQWHDGVESHNWF